jgi:alpha-galactosidase
MRISCIILCMLIISCQNNSLIPQETNEISAQRPPMGWNSWNSMGFEIREHHVKEIADYMSENLLEYGYEYLVLDAGWYYPETFTTNMGHYKNPQQSIDPYGRLIPDTVKFPSSAGGKGFKEIADYVHSKGLKFGIHIMRGIPWNAYQKNTPIWNTSLYAQDVGQPDIACEWNHSMYGLNCKTGQGKAYYESIIELYKEWGVDFIKIDDISRPIHKAEIKAFHEAVQQSGRDIVISLSPGASPLEEADFLGAKAHMWRISNDVWDTWPLVKRNFDYCSQWHIHSKPGSWPDADMLPIGKLRVTGADDWVAGLIGAPLAEIKNEFSRLLPDEQYTVMNLWSMFRSPLIIGSWLPANDDFSNSLLTNRDLIELNQNSEANKEILRTENLSVWTAKNQTKDIHYLAVFNMSDSTQNVSINENIAGFSFAGNMKDIWSKEKTSVNSAGNIHLVLQPHASIVIMAQ